MSRTALPTVAAIEGVEAEAWAQWQLNTPAQFRRRFEIDVHRRGGAAALVAASADVLALNRVIGLGVAAPCPEDELDAIIHEYARAGVRQFVIQLAPMAQPLAIGDWLTARGFRIVSSWSKLVLSLYASEPDWSVDPALDVVEIGSEDAVTFEGIVGGPLCVPPEMGCGIRSTVGVPGWRYYLVRDGQRAIAGACYFALGEGAWFGAAATIEAERGRGAHTALFARRILDAKSDGCTWATTETMTETRDQPNQSYRNMIRVGFQKQYDRPNWVLDLSAPSVA